MVGISSETPMWQADPKPREDMEQLRLFAMDSNSLTLFAFIDEKT